MVIQTNFSTFMELLPPKDNKGELTMILLDNHDREIKHNGRSKKST